MRAPKSRLTLAAATIAMTIAASPAPGSAQVLSGTYIRYLSFGNDGAMIGPTMQSMAYGETTTGPVSCDLYYPGSPHESFTIQVAGATFTNSSDGGDALTTTTAPTLSGRTITWRGQVRGAVSLDIEQVATYEPDDRVMRMTVRVTNAGSLTLTDLYYLRNGDPDHGQCNIGTDHATVNDVRRQPPLDTSALTTALAGDTGRTVVLGIGSFDTRARVHNGGFANTNAIGEWTSPADGAGARSDVAVDIVFRHASLAAGASTTFEILYAWGTTVADVEARFDAATAPCTGEGSSCADAAGAAGTCHSGRCCTGCWDGTRCHPPGTLSACGVAGGACADCEDANACTTDTCIPSSGSCFHANTASGTSCDDGLFCTATDACDGAGRCLGSGTRCDDSNPCTTDACDETGDRCTTTPRVEGSACMGATPGVCHGTVCCRGCWDGSTCQTGLSASACGTAGGPCRSCSDGVACTIDSCLGGACSNPPAPADSACDDGRYCTLGDVCDGLGACLGGTMTPCDDGSTCTIDSCNDATRTCSHTPVAMGCIIAGTCHGAGAIDPSNPCRVCDPSRSGTDWSIAIGASCGTASCSAGVLTRAATCDASGSCVAGERTPCPTGACISATMCDTPCGSDDDCGGFAYCDMLDGRCRPHHAPGAGCERDGQCALGSVCSDDGRCCDDRCVGVCASCALPGREGFCLPVPAGSDPDDECPGECNGAGMCDEPSTDGGSVADGGSTPDAGTAPRDGGDAGPTGPLDGGEGDAGGPAFASYGCCGIAGSRDPSPTSIAVLIVLGFVLLQRRRRARRSSAARRAADRRTAS